MKHPSLLSGPSILGLGTALPQYSLEQKQFEQILGGYLQLDPAQAEQMRKIFRHSAIDRRYSVLFDSEDPAQQHKIFAQLRPETNPGMGKRNDIYKEEAPKLAQACAQKALSQWGGDPKAITHVISVSCTGMIAPGLEFLLADQLQLQRGVRRLGVNFMGCFGAFSGLSVAKALALQDPSYRILLVCTELCSLHFNLDDRSDTFVANALFADGAASAVIGAEPQASEHPLWNISKQSSLALKNSLNDMTWEASDHGYVMRLSQEVPKLVQETIHPFVTSFCDAPLRECSWAVHPGGKAILLAITHSCGLDKRHLHPSWEILRRCGNLSSATFLFVLEELWKTGQVAEWSVGLGFGPGLSLEGILLQKAG
jgi:predicted naringenin-chalcone synthase